MPNPPAEPPTWLLFADGRKVAAARYGKLDGLWSPWGGVFQTYRGVIWCRVEDGSWRVFDVGGREVFRAQSWREAAEVALLWPAPVPEPLPSQSNP